MDSNCRDRPWETIVKNQTVSEPFLKNNLRGTFALSFDANKSSLAEEASKETSAPTLIHLHVMFHCKLLDKVKKLQANKNKQIQMVKSQPVQTVQHQTQTNPNTTALKIAGAELISLLKTGS